MKSILRSGLATIALAAGLGATPVSAAHIMRYNTNLTPINGVGSGFATFTLDTTAKTLLVNITASGLDDGMHLAHLHGRFTNGATGAPRDSVLPPPSADTDGDGFIELAEALPSYGFIILPLSTVGVGTSINYSQMFDLTDPSIYGFVGGDMSNPRYTMDDLVGADYMALDLRELIVHGQNTPAVGANTPGEVDGTAGYKAVLPTLGGEVSAIPEPATWGMMLLGFGAIGSVVRRKRRVSVRYA